MGKFILGDCMDLETGLPSYPDRYFDLAIVDPPYGIGFDGQKQSTSSHGGRRAIEFKGWDSGRPNREYFKQLFRVSKNQIVWGCNYYRWHFGPGRIIWDKVNDGTSFSDCEEAYCSLHDSSRIFRFMWNGMMQGKSAMQGHLQQGNKALNEKRIHPTQKPVTLYKWLLQRYAQPGWTILDTHLGSGSSRIAAFDLGFNFTGIELNKTHFENQEKRFAQHTAQLHIRFA